MMEYLRIISLGSKKIHNLTKMYIDVYYNIKF